MCITTEQVVQGLISSLLARRPQLSGEGHTPSSTLASLYRHRGLMEGPPKGPSTSWMEVPNECPRGGLNKRPNKVPSKSPREEPKKSPQG